MLPLMIDPEPIMDVAVTSMGGIRLLPPANRPGDYADYVFRSDNIVAELKSLQNQDLTEDWWGGLVLSKYDGNRGQDIICYIHCSCGQIQYHPPESLRSADPFGNWTSWRTLPNDAG